MLTYLTENDIVSAIFDAINTFYLNEPNTINEDVINGEEFAGSYPFNKFKVKINTRDHYPRHFHVIRDDWEMTFRIIDGSPYQLKHKGKNASIGREIIELAPKWLKEKSAKFPSRTNQEVALDLWEYMHQGDKFKPKNQDY